MICSAPELAVAPARAGFVDKCLRSQVYPLMIFSWKFGRIDADQHQR
jgi:hypothetical protein